MPYTAMQMAEAFIQTGELQDAVEALRNHLQEHPIDRKAKRLLASILFRLRGMSNLEEAKQLLEGLDTADDHIMRGLIEEQISVGLPSIGEFQQAWNTNPSDERLAEMYIERLVSGGSERYLSDAMSVVLKMPRTWRWLQTAGDLAARQHAYSWAVAYYNDALADLDSKVDTENNAFTANMKANLLLKRANTYLEARELDAAETDYQTAQKIVPDDEIVIFQLGLVAFLRGNLDEAVSLCKVALEDTPTRIQDILNWTLRQPQYEALAVLVYPEIRR